MLNNSYEVDSLKLRIPFENVKVINQELLGNLILINDITGEEKGTFKERCFSVNDNGIHTYFGIEKMNITGKSKDYLVMLINSKLLESNYFQGITETNKKQIYNKLLSYNVVSFDYKDFENAVGTDIDFKKDLRINESFDLITSYMLTITKEQSKSICKRYKKENNKGIQWSRREETKTDSRPYFKIYHKGIDLLNKENGEFYNTYLKGIDVSDIVRVEFTIKNKKHFRKYGIEETTLNNILSIPNEVKNKMFQDAVSNHLDIYEIKPQVIRENLRPNDIVILASMDMLMQTKELTSDKMIQYLVQNISDVSQKSKKKKELTQLYQERLKSYNVENEKQGKIKETVLKLLNTLL